ncbi:MAG TPA: carboxypeptidase-like regulatory domain-containing protein [Candidatus Limnocylindrales bacterium]|nr:carboxypeptidase-like regulatory domain-containing protein [Candidatus Limnocylindrales bacterium]
MKRTILLVLAFCLSAGAQSKTELSVTVLDQLGAVISDAQVRVHWDHSGSNVGLKDNIGVAQDLVLETDKTGHAKIELPPGFYDVFVAAPAFTPQAFKIRVKKEPQGVLFKLKADPLVTHELGDKFPTK